MIGIVTCAEHFFDGASQEPDDRLLLAALHSAGQEARSVKWDDPAVDWSAFSQCIIRSAWDYHCRRETFLSWAERVAGATRLWNPLPVIRWNTHKRYLRELESRGVPVVPTEWLAAGEKICLADRVQPRRWSRFVIKPSVATNSYGARVFTSQALDAAQAHLDTLLARHETMLQPYLPSIQGYGERSLVFIDGELTHAFRKRPAFVGGGHTQGEIAVIPTNGEAALARAILKQASAFTGIADPASFLFARVDLVRDERGAMRLMELELVEPRLRLDIVPRALERLVRAICKRDQANDSHPLETLHLQALIA